MVAKRSRPLPAQRGPAPLLAGSTLPLNQGGDFMTSIATETLTSYFVGNNVLVGFSRFSFSTDQLLFWAAWLALLAQLWRVGSMGLTIDLEILSSERRDQLCRYNLKIWK